MIVTSWTAQHLVPAGALLLALASFPLPAHAGVDARGSHARIDEGVRSAHARIGFCRGGLAGPCLLGCPRVLAPDAGSPAGVIRAVQRAANRVFRGSHERPFHIVQLQSFYPGENEYASSAWIGIAVRTCGRVVAFHSWAADVRFPYWVKQNHSAARSQALLFVAHTPHGWTVWYRS